jgi:ubiquinone/menaquinone biosynthesis C-methylase UbiE
MNITMTDNGDRMARAFDDLAPGYDHAHHDEVARALIDFAGPPCGGAAADVACGSGAVALLLARRRLAAEATEATEAAGVAEATGSADAPILAIDISPGMIAAARERAAHSGPGVAAAIDWRIGSAVPLPVPDDSLDLVLCASSLHFLGAAALRDWQRALRPGRRAAFTLPVAAGFRPSGTFAELLAGDVPAVADAAAARAFALDSGFAGAEAKPHTSGGRQVVLVVAHT